MSAPSSLFEFLEQTGAKVLVYDLGRRIGLLPRDPFIAFEHLSAAYPRPLQRQAWIALVQLPSQSQTDPVIWFLRLHLDEQGLLVQAERDYLLDRLLDSARAAARGADPQGLLRDNPYAFKPRHDRMALFHALLSKQLEQPPSRYYAHARDYFRGIPGWDQWGFVGYQGIADMACRGDDNVLTGAIPALPREPLAALCHCLESRQLPAALIVALIERLRQTLTETQPDIASLAALVRGISGSTSQPAVITALSDLLKHEASTSIELLATLSGRAWEALHQPQLMDLFLSRLASNDHGQDAFERCLDDLLSLPELSTATRQYLRKPDCPDTVRSAFGVMLAGRRDRD